MICHHPKLRNPDTLRSSGRAAILLLGAAILTGCTPAQRGRTVMLDTSAVAEAQSARFPFSAGFVAGEPLTIERDLARGVEHRFSSRPDQPLTINAVFANLADGDLRLEVIKARNSFYHRETVPDMVARESTAEERIVAAINGDFWGSAAVPINAFVDEGIIWKLYTFGESNSGRNYARFAFDDQGNYYIGQDPITAELVGPGESVAIDDVNVPHDFMENILYTWPVETVPDPQGWNRATFDLPSGTWLPNDPQEVTVRSVGGEGELQIDKNTVVFHSKAPLPDWVQAGAVGTLEATFEGLPGRVLGTIGGGGWLLHDGHIVADQIETREMPNPNFITDRHPRTAIGILPDRDTVLFVTVDGRQTGLSTGVSLQELAEVMKELGAQDALNLDGGGSTTMVVNGELVNFPSDPSGPRAVTNGISVRYGAEQTAELAGLIVDPGSSNAVTVPAGAQLQLRVQGLSNTGEPKPIPPAARLRGSTSGPATLSPNGLLAIGGTGAIQATVTAAGGDLSGSAELVAADAETLTFEPSRLLLSRDGTSEVVLRAENTEGPLAGKPFFANFLVPDVEVPPFVQWNQATRTVRAIGQGKGEIVARLGGLEARLPVAVDEYELDLVYGFNDPPPANEDEWMTLLRADAAGTNLSLARGVQKEGEACWRWQYAMTGGGTTKIALPLGAQIPGDPQELGLWVRGDGQNQWLRGTLEDAHGTRYYMDFTTAQAGISWTGEWRFLRSSVLQATPTAASNNPKTPPYKLVEVYLVQPQEAAKRDGTIWLDALSALRIE